MMHSAPAASLMLAATLFTACDPGPADVRELEDGQKEILAKIDELEAAIAQPTVDSRKVYNIPVGRIPLRGPRDAKVTIVTFSDFECPSSRIANGIILDVLREYPDDVNFTYKQFPLTGIHPSALPAARAALAAAKQGKFWEMHDMIFERFEHSDRHLDPDELIKYLKEHGGDIGLDVSQWEKDLGSAEIEEQVRRDVSDGRAADVVGTPTIFVAGRRLQKNSLEGFKELIEEARREGVEGYR